MKISYSGNQIIIDGYPIQFSIPIKEIKLFEDLVLVLLTVPKGIINNRNVYAVNRINKKIDWEIQEPDLIYNDTPYVNFMDFIEGIVVGNWNGIAYLIDPKDGSIIKSIQTK